MPKENLIYRLDNLEYQYHYLNNTLDGFKPRLNGTSKIFNAKGKRTTKKVAKTLQMATLESLTSQLDILRLEILQKKAYHLEKKIASYLEKTLQQQSNALSKHTNAKNETKRNTLAVIEREYTFPKFANLIAKSKVAKLVVSKVTPTRTLKEDPPHWFKDSEYLQIINTKESQYNPGNIWNKTVLPIKGCDQLLSLTMNSKKYKEIVESFDSGMDLFLNNKREKKADASQNEAGLSKGDSKRSEKSSKGQPSSGESSEDQSEESSEAESDEESGRSSVSGESQTANIDEDAILKAYEGMLVASDDEAAEEESFMLNPNINYNEVTDEEPSAEDSEPSEASSDEEEEQPRKRQKKEKESKKKVVLPELISGYYSGGSEDELSEDEVAKKQISNQPKRKNRRGQRARQKIWEKKYGKNAKHIQKQLEKDKEEKQQRQIEYEERVAKRAAKAKALEETAQHHREKAVSNNRTSEKPEDKPMHPSWEAKKLAEEKLKNVKFQGKKIVF
ncbi:LAFE_0H15148g1_1 [Lachancea fermentati]|uniref:LAFE_0H15148g1_1 n=1 Tax=Lachancea fermentati TaxID=4955 RepID=A0A1G4MKV6_LACFM|nr:LAFE_0H15148g1_1 [Lachancea fermentati]